MAIDPKRFISIFVADCRDNLTRFGEALGALEQVPVDPEIINGIFRAAHTIKGSARMLKLGTISDTAHQLEDVLGAVRESRIVITPALIGLLANASDAIAALVDRVAEGGDLPPPDAALCAALALAAQGSPVAPHSDSGAGAAAPTPVPQAAIVSIPEPQIPELAPAEHHLKTSDTVRVQLTKLDDLIKMMGELASTHGRLLRRVEDLREAGLRLTDTASEEGHARLNRVIADIRNDISTQGLMMSELGSSALSMRMLPLSWAFEPASRMVRELGRSLGKPVECLVQGGGIELDRQIIDRLGDSLVHILRNCVDHGIEAAEVRQAAGKAAQGKIKLAARQDGAVVVVEISDDGGGLALDRLRDKAVQRGIVDADRACALSEDQLVDLVFVPGLSTSPIITDLSGRGVGMDVVKKTIVEELHGIVTVETHPGQGTLFSLRLPMSLAIMRVLSCEASGIAFAFTAQYVAEIVRVSRHDLREVAGGQAMVVRNEFVHLVSLAGLLHLPGATPSQASSILVVIVHAGAGKLGLIIDALRDERDMVIKPLPSHLSALSLVSGMVVSNRDELVSILNVPKLLEMAKVLRGESLSVSAVTQLSTKTRILVVDDSLNTREIEKEVLESHGFTVTLAEDGLDGWQKAMADDFDAVLTDVEMPGLDGFALTSKLRGHSRYQNIPIIIITSRDKEDDKRRGIDVGADAYIVKGDFNQTGLVDTLRSLLG
jgi:two-component system, chemotaxis family, sensor kinase CheA